MIKFVSSPEFFLSNIKNLVKSILVYIYNSIEIIKIFL